MVATERWNTGEHIWVPSVNGYVAFFDVSVPPCTRNNARDNEHDEDEYIPRRISPVFFIFLIFSSPFTRSL